MVLTVGILLDQITLQRKIWPLRYSLASKVVACSSFLRILMSLPSVFIMGANKFVIVWGVCTRIFRVLFLRGWVDAKSFTFCMIKVVVFNIFPIPFA